MVAARSGAQFVSHYTPAKTRHYEAALQMAAQQAMASEPLFEGPLRLTLQAIFSIPESWSIKKKKMAADGELRPTGKPDADNILKSVDALNKVVWKDDAQCIDVRIAKWYGPKPELQVSIEEWRR
jgi:Holliday junction resolvase RusA-like endonuclease